MILAAPSLSLARIPGRGAPPIPFAPTDLPDLELWLDAEEGVINTAGNNFTDETASIYLISTGSASSGLTLEIGTSLSFSFLESNFGQIEGNYYVVDTPFGGETVVFKANGVWVKTDIDTGGAEPNFLNTVYSTGSVSYPWQATWPSGTTVTRTATTFDVPATNDETVTRWVNKVSGKPNLNQVSLASQPVFKSDVFGRKAVYFYATDLAGDILNGTELTIGNNVSYYIVSTSINYVTNTGRFAVLTRFGTSNTSYRGAFGVDDTDSLAVANLGLAGETLTPDLSGLVSNDAKIWSVRFVDSTFYVGANKTFGTRVSSGVIGQTTMSLGAGRTTGTRGVTTNVSEVLVYNSNHDEATALQIIDYLAQKWNINPES